VQLTRIIAALCAAGVLAIAGCGGDDDEPADGGGTAQETATAEPAPEETEAPEETAAPEETEEAGGDAEQTFATTCGGCHTLGAAGTSGQVGPNLDDLAPDQDRVLNAIATGPGAMPENLLEGAEAEAVAEYVSSNAGG